MRIDILSLFPSMFSGPIHNSIVGKAISQNQLQIEVTDFRQYSTNKHGNVDDYPFGGGAGMLLQIQPIFDAFQDTQRKANDQGIESGRVVLMDPAGQKLDQSVTESLSHEKHLTFICGHYEGYDERIRSLVTDEISIGDYILTGGELPAMVIIDAVTRLLPGVLGNAISATEDSFSNGLLEYPQYTRPAEYRGMTVPEVLLNGNHHKIHDWRERESLKRTLHRRPDLLESASLSTNQKMLLHDIKK